MADYKDKIRKLLALAQSPEEAEAKAALLRARELMAQHKLTEADLEEAKKQAVQFMQAGQQLPVKNSYMFCDTLDMCFFYGPGDTPKVAYAGHAGADERDITEGKLVEAFRKADTVLRAMKRFAGEEG